MMTDEEYIIYSKNSHSPLVSRIAVPTALDIL